LRILHTCLPTTTAVPERIRERGSALIVVVLVLLSVSTLATAMIVTSLANHQIAANERDSERALFASKSGLAYAYQLFADGTLTPTDAGTSFNSLATPVNAALKGADFTGEIYIESGQGGLYRIESTGRYGNSARTTELVFQWVAEAFRFGYMAFNKAQLDNHSGLAGPSFRIESTVFSNGEVTVADDLTLDGAIVAVDSVTLKSGSIVVRDVFANSVDNDGTILGQVEVRVVCGVQRSRILRRQRHGRR